MDFIAGRATCQPACNATALIRAVAFWAAGASFGSAAGWADGPPTGRRGMYWCGLNHSVLAVRQRHWILLRFTIFGGLPSHTDAWQVAVFIALKAESVDT